MSAQHPGTTVAALSDTTYETTADWSENMRDPPPREACGMCLKHWTRCTCDPDDPEMHRRIAVERALRAGDDETAQALLGGGDV